MTQVTKPSKTSGIKIALAVIPALLIVSVCVALYLGAKADQEESEPVQGDVTVPEMADYLFKLNRLIGERTLDTEAGQLAFREYRAMALGTLGPENLGYEIFRTQKDSANGLLWPTIWVNAGDRDSEEPVVLAIPQAESGTAAAFAFGFAEYLTSHETSTGVRVVFYPPLVDGDLAAWVWQRCGQEGETMKGFIKVTGGFGQDRETRFCVPDRLRPLLQEVSSSKIWGDEMLLDGEPHPFFEVRLVEGDRLSRPDHAGKLIRVMPVVKDLLERLGE